MIDIDVIEEFFKKSQKEYKEMKNVNILVVGKTGVGKSTLINNIFREELAETGVGKPVTQHLKKITKEGIPITLYDTKGLELNEEVQHEIKKEILDEIDKCKKSCVDNNDHNDLMHVCWYCLDGSTPRCEDTDIEWINDIGNELPVIVVITKGFFKSTAKNFKKEIENLNLNCKNIIPVLAQSHEEVDEDNPNNVIRFDSYGLDKLVDATYEILPETVRTSFNNAQKVSIDSKVKEATKWLLGYITGSGVIGFSPIPFSDAAILASEQVAMIVHITKIFGLDIDKSLITSIISAITGISGATFAGRTLVSNLLKFVPGIGSAAGGAISASVASLMTAALGYSYINVMKYILEQELKGIEVTNEEVYNKMKYEYKNEIKIRNRN